MPARPPLPCSVASVTVRYTSTWRARPAPTASTALTTAASCAAPSMPPVCQPTSRRRASCTSGVPGPLKPGPAPAAGARVGGDAVDVGGGEPGVGDGLQGGVDREVEAGAAQPPPHVGLADAGDDRPAFELGHAGSRPRARALGLGLEDGEPDEVVLLEGDPHRHADAHVVDRAVDEVAREAQAVLLVEGHQHDDVGLGAAVPRLVVHRVGEHLPAAAHGLGGDLAAPALGAAGHRRVQVVAARLAAQEAEPPVLARRPEEPVVVVQGGLHAEGRSAHPGESSVPAA